MYSVPVNLIIDIHVHLKVIMIEVIDKQFGCGSDKNTLVSIFKETTESVTFRMLDNVVALEVIQTRLTQQIRPYMKEHHLKEDVVFTKYVKVLALSTVHVLLIIS